MYIRDSANAWKRGGGAAEVSETAPTNPSIGQLWVKPSEVFPVPVRTQLGNFSTLTTSETWVQATALGSVSLTTPKACLATLSFATRIAVTGTGPCEAQMRLGFTGSLTGASDSQGGSGVGSLVQWTSGARVYSTLFTSFTIALPVGTFTVSPWVWRSGLVTSVEYNSVNVGITPISWVDQYADGVS